MANSDVHQKSRMAIAAAGLIVITALLLIATAEYSRLQSKQNHSSDTLAMRLGVAEEYSPGSAPGYPGDVEELLLGIPVFTGAEYQLSGYGNTCPIRLPLDCVQLCYQQSVATESWYTYSTMGCREAARELLLGLEEDGFVLVKAEFLDLTKEAWGCVVKSEGDRVFIVTLIPESKSISSKSPGEANKLVITVIHIKTPEIELMGSDTPIDESCEAESPEDEER